MHRFAAVAVVDPLDRLLVQERGDDALHAPGCWGYPGGDLEAGEDFVSAAVRELREETGLVVDPGDLESLGVRRFRSESCGEDAEFELFAVRTRAGDDDVTCLELRAFGRGLGLLRLRFDLRVASDARDAPRLRARGK